MNNTNMIKVTSNINTLQRILNYFRIRNKISNPSAGAYYASCKWSNSMFRLHVGNCDAVNRNIEPVTGVFPHYDHIGCGDSIISSEMYNLIHEVVKKRQAEFFVQIDEGEIDTVTDIVIAILEASFTIYSMAISLWRTQSGYLFKDEDKVYLGPIFYNHEAKGASSADWNISLNSSFAEEIIQTSLNTQAKIKASNEVWGVYGITNEQWATCVTELLNACYLPNNLRWMAEHLFGTVFVDPEPAYTMKTVTLFPDSPYVKYTWDSANSLWQASSVELNGYDNYSADDGATNQDNGGTFADFVAYYTNWVENMSEFFNHYPYLDKILDDLQFTNKSVFDFTRDVKHSTIYFVTGENITDFIQSVATPAANPEVPDINQPLASITSVVPFSVRENTEMRYGNTLDYHDEAEITLDYSFEYFWKGKVYPCRFAYFGYDQNNLVGYYRYQYLEQRICSDFSNTPASLSLMYLNANLRDFEAVETIHNVEMNSFPASGQGGAGIVIVPSLRCYYNPLENIEEYANRAYDTFIAPNYQK